MINRMKKMCVITMSLFLLSTVEACGQNTDNRKMTAIIAENTMQEEIEEKIDNKTETDKTETDKTETDKTETDKTETDKTEADKAESDKAESENKLTKMEEDEAAAETTAEVERKKEEQDWYWKVLLRLIWNVLLIKPVLF